MHPKVLLHSRQILSVRPSVCRSRSRQRLDVRAGVLTATGPKFAAEAVSVKGTLGEGSYGQVFEVSSLSASCARSIPLSSLLKCSKWQGIGACLAIG